MTRPHMDIPDGDAECIRVGGLLVTGRILLNISSARSRAVQYDRIVNWASEVPDLGYRSQHKNLPLVSEIVLLV